MRGSRTLAFPSFHSLWIHNRLRRYLYLNNPLCFGCYRLLFEQNLPLRRSLPDSQHFGNLSNRAHLSLHRYTLRNRGLADGLQIQLHIAGNVQRNSGNNLCDLVDRHDSVYGIPVVPKQSEGEDRLRDSHCRCLILL